MAGPDRGHPRGPISRRLKRADGGSTSGSLSLLFDHLAAAVLLTARLPSAGLTLAARERTIRGGTGNPHSDVIAAVLATEGRSTPPARSAARGPRRVGVRRAQIDRPELPRPIPDRGDDLAPAVLHGLLWIDEPAEEQNGGARGVADQEQERVIGAEGHRRFGRRGPPQHQPQRSRRRRFRAVFVDVDEGLVRHRRDEQLACAVHAGEVGVPISERLGHAEPANRLRQLERRGGLEARSRVTSTRAVLSTSSQPRSPPPANCRSISGSPSRSAGSTTSITSSPDAYGSSRSWPPAKVPS